MTMIILFLMIIPIDYYNRNCHKKYHNNPNLINKEEIRNVEDKISFYHKINMNKYKYWWNRHLNYKCVNNRLKSDNLQYRMRNQQHFILKV